MVCFRRSPVKGSTACQYTSLQVPQCYKGLEQNAFGVIISNIFSLTIEKRADSAIRCISLTCSKPSRCQNLPVAQFHLWSEIYSEWRTGGEFLAKQSVIAEGKYSAVAPRGTCDLMSLWRIFRSCTCFSARQIWTNQSKICTGGRREGGRLR